MQAKDINAKLVRIDRVSISGAHVTESYDDNAIRLILKIEEGPTALLGRKVKAEMGISEFVESLPAEVARRLLAALNEGENDVDSD